MKIKFYYLFLLILSACSNPKKEADVNIRLDSTQLLNQPKPSLSNPLLQKIIGDTTGILRGHNFGDAIEEIVLNEKIEKFEEEKSHVGFTFDTANLETVDILYLKDKKNKLNGIQIDIYMNSDSTNEKLFTSFSDYLTSKYGPQIPKMKIAIWQIDDKSQVYIKKVKSRLDRGLEVKYYQK